MYLKKIWILGVSLFTLFFLISMFSLNAYAMEGSYQDFSAYVNCFKGDVYNTPVYITPLTKTNYYNVGTKCYAKYAEKTITGRPKINNFGFKINDEFYTSSVLLGKNGTYVIESFPYKKENGIIKPSTDVPLETIYVIVDLEYKVEMKRTIFSYDAFDSVSAFMESVNQSFTKPVTINPDSITLLKNTYNACKKNKEKRVVEISCRYENIDYKFNITISPFTEEIGERFVDLREAATNIKGIAFKYVSSYKGLGLVESLRGSITNKVIDSLNLASEQSVELDFKNDNTYPTLTSSEDLYRPYTLEISIVDSITNSNNVYVELPILIYQPAFVKEDNLACEYSSYSYLPSQDYLNPVTTFLKFEMGSREYYDLETTPSITGIIDVNNLKLTTTLSYDGIKRTISNKIIISEIVETIKIVTNYNYIFLTKADSLEYRDQVGVLVNSKLYKANETKEFYFNYDIFNENNTDMLKITLFNAKTNQEIETKIVRIVYRSSNSENFFQKFLKSYGNFLRSIF